MKLTQVELHQRDVWGVPANWSIGRVHAAILAILESERFSASRNCSKAHSY